MGVAIPWPKKAWPLYMIRKKIFLCFLKVVGDEQNEIE